MKIGFTTYPTAFQRAGGLEVQMRETADALIALGHDVRIVDLYTEKLCDYDLIHHFSLKHSSIRILQYAKLCGIPVVATPLMNPWKTSWELRRINFLRSLLHRLFGNDFSGYWDDLARSFELCDAIFPLTDAESQTIAHFQPSAARICTVVPNGISDFFFQAQPHLYHKAFGDAGKFVLVPSSIEPRKNQLAIVRAAVAEGISCVLAGPILDQDYFNACRNVDADSVAYLGELPYSGELLVSAFAAASCVPLLSQVEPFGLTPFEALASGTPSILTTTSGVTTESHPPFFFRVPPNDQRALRHALTIAVNSPRDRAACRRLAQPLRWGSSAEKLDLVYQSIFRETTMKS